MDDNGTRFEVSPFGLSRTIAGGAVQDCRWWPTFGDASLCAAAADAAPANQFLHMSYPLLQGTLWGAIIALFLVVLRAPRRRSVRVTISAAVGACAVAAVFAMVSGAPSLAALAGLDVTFSLVGAIAAWVAVASTTVSTMLQLGGD